ncbi:hypothetical protein PJL18_04404 [Paenarthrobacter nicotinovorans]|nr:hypothetical protein [Paenarthrobacter nicotinovorans]
MRKVSTPPTRTKASDDANQNQRSAAIRVVEPGFWIRGGKAIRKTTRQAASPNKATGTCDPFKSGWASHV